MTTITDRLNEMAKPREFWISENRIESCDCISEGPLKPNIDDCFGPFKVIEYAAYARLIEALKIADEALQKYTMTEEQAVIDSAVFGTAKIFLEFPKGEAAREAQASILRALSGEEKKG